ncbi:cytochrome P450 [Actinorhabdospora filicis]|nr:cytochrome P450 [Actinorhabdospora filicis]
MAAHFFRAGDERLSHAGGWDLVFGDRFGRGVLNLDGPRHRDYRKALLPLLTRRAASGYEPVAREVLDRALTGVAADAPVDLHALVKPIVFEVSATLFAGITGEAAMELLGAYTALQDPGDALGTADGRRVARQVVGARRRLRAALGEAVAAMTDVDGPVRRLRELPDPPGDEEIAQNLAILILAGFETTSYVTARMLWLLARHPGHQDALRADGSAFAAVFAETTRLHPPLAWLPRTAATDLSIADTAIPAGSGVYFDIAATHRDPEVFEAPDEFRPERHAAPPQGKFAQVPFSAGRRVCAGIHVGTMEAETITTGILRRFRLTAPPGAHIGDVSANGSTVTPAAPLLARCHPLP